MYIFRGPTVLLSIMFSGPSITGRMKLYKTTCTKNKFELCMNLIKIFGFDESLSTFKSQAEIFDKLINKQNIFSEISMLKTSIPDQFKHILRVNNTPPPKSENTNAIFYDKTSSSFKKTN